MDCSARLPAETLLGIFCAVQDVHPIPSAIDIISNFRGEDIALGRRTLRLLAWISLTHVCARWRSLALDVASLWTEVPVVLGNEWLQEFLHRSVDMSISIDWRAWQTHSFPGLVPYSDMENMIVPFHYRRLRNFEAQLESNPPLFPLLSHVWPVLEDLSVELTGDFPSYVLLGNDAPCLRRLTFGLESDTIGCETFPWRAPFLRTLVVLDIYFYEGITATSIDIFLDALDVMSVLAHLRIGNSISAEALGLPCPSCSPMERIVLATNLRTFALRGTWSMIHHFMKHIHPLPTCRISVGAQNEHHAGDHVSGLRSIYAQLAAYKETNASPYSGYDAAEVTFHRYTGTVRAFRSPHTVTSTSWTRHLTPGDWYKGVAGAHPDLQVQVSRSLITASDLIGSTDGLSPHGLRSLSLNMPDLAINFILMKFSALLQNVHTLQLNGISGERVGQLLVTFPNAHVPTLFPALRVIDARDCSVQQMLGRSIPNVVTIPPLADILDARRTEGFPIPAVYLRVEEEIRSLRGGTTDIGVLREVERLEAVPGVIFVGEEEELVYDLAL